MGPFQSPLDTLAFHQRLFQLVSCLSCWRINSLGITVYTLSSIVVYLCAYIDLVRVDGYWCTLHT